MRTNKKTSRGNSRKELRENLVGNNKRKKM